MSFVEGCPLRGAPLYCVYMYGVVHVLCVAHVSHMYVLCVRYVRHVSPLNDLVEKGSGTFD